MAADNTSVSRDEILAVIQRGVNTVLVERAPMLSADSRLTDDLGIDSLDLIEIAMEVETELGVAFENDEFEGIETVGHLIDLISDKLSASQTA